MPFPESRRRSKLRFDGNNALKGDLNLSTQTTFGGLNRIILDLSDRHQIFCDMYSAVRQLVELMKDGQTYKLECNCINPRFADALAMLARIFLHERINDARGMALERRKVKEPEAKCLGFRGKRA